MQMSWAIRDKFRFAKTLTLFKLINFGKVWGSYYFSLWMHKPYQTGMPLSLAIEPTTSCNLRCPECPSGLRSFTRPTGILSQTHFETIIDQVKGSLMNLTLYFQGEPYLHPAFTSLVNYATSQGIYTLTSTNAHYLTEQNAIKTVQSGLHRLIISVDGATQQSYEKYRIGGQLNKVLEGTKALVQARKNLRSSTPHIVFQFLVVKHNEHEIPQVYQMAKELGIDEVQLKTAQIYDYENGSPLIPENQLYSRYRKKANGQYVVKNKLLNQCWKMWHSCVITWDGKVVPCCFDKDAHHVMGIVPQQSFYSIWKSDAYRAFRQLLLHGRSQIEMCTNCTEGTSVFDT